MKMLARAVSLSLVLAAASGCGGGNDAGRETVSATPEGGGVPAARVTLHLESLREGRSADQDDYRQAIGICEAAGLPVRPLSDDQVARLDTAVVELLSDAERRLSRQTRWTRRSSPGPEGLCLFEFEEVVSERHMDPRSTGWSEGDGSGWQEVAATAGEFRAHPVDAAEQAGIARQLGWTHLGESSVAGRPCERWRSDSEESCLWSGGGAAGYSSAPSSHVGCFSTSFERFEASIPLEVEPADGTGCRIRVASMEVSEGTLPAADVVPVTRGRKG